MCATTSFLRSLGVEIYASGHCRWSDTAKAQAVAYTLEVGATVNAVAERYGILSNQLSAWRRLAKQGKLLLLAPEATEPLFAATGGFCWAGGTHRSSDGPEWVYQIDPWRDRHRAAASDPRLSDRRDRMRLKLLHADAIARCSDIGCNAAGGLS